MASSNNSPEDVTKLNQRILTLESENSELLADKEQFKAEREKMKEIVANSLRCMEQMRVTTQVEVRNMQLQTDCMDYLKNLRGLRAASQIMSETASQYQSSGSSSQTPSTMTTTSTNTNTESIAILNCELQEKLFETNKELEELRTIYANETNILKEVILAEREEYEKLLAEEKERKLVAQNESENRILVELDPKQGQIDEERRSMRMLRNQWTEEKKHLMATAENLKKDMEALKRKLKKEKTTVAHYKMYSEAKDKYFKEEIERIQKEYEQRRG